MDTDLVCRVVYYAEPSRPEAAPEPTFFYFDLKKLLGRNSIKLLATQLKHYIQFYTTPSPIRPEIVTFSVRQEEELEADQALEEQDRFYQYSELGYPTADIEVRTMTYLFRVAEWLSHQRRWLGVKELHSYMKHGHLPSAPFPPSVSLAWMELQLRPPENRVYSLESE